MEYYIYSSPAIPTSVYEVEDECNVNKFYSITHRKRLEGKELDDFNSDLKNGILKEVSSVKDGFGRINQEEQIDFFL